MRKYNRYMLHYSFVFHLLDSSTSHTASERALCSSIEMVLCAMPHRLENERLGQEQFDVVIFPGICWQPLQKHDDLL